MKLQLAVDDLSVEEGLKLCKKIEDYIDIIEMGTPFLMREGLKAVTTFADAFPEKEILADLKIMDGGGYEASMAFDAKAAYITTMAVTDSSTIAGCVAAANKYNKLCMADMLCVSDFSVMAPKLEEMGVHILAVHTGYDQQDKGKTPLEELKELVKYRKKAKIAVAGGINSTTIDQYVELNPDIVIVGTGITHANDPVLEAKKIKEKLRGE